MRNRWGSSLALAERLLAFERLDTAWPRGCTAIERAVRKAAKPG